MAKSDLVHQMNQILDIMKNVMREGEHYGKIPGTQKNTLFQTGAQKLLTTFRLGSDEDVINTDEREFSVSYRVKVKLFNIADGNTVGFGIGECSSLEDKYAYRKAVNDAEFDSYHESRRRIKHFQPFGKPAYTVKQVAVNYKDVANTVLKMAKKRALVDATLTATAAGDVFTQDLEDMEPLTRESILDAEILPKSTAPKASNGTVSLQEIKDAVNMLSYEKDREKKQLGTKIKEEENGKKSFLVVIGSTFTHKTLLEKMGFKFYKPQGAQYGEYRMDVTHLLEANYPLGKPNVSKPTTLAELEERVAKLGHALKAVTINSSPFVEVVSTKNIHKDMGALKSLGFVCSNDESKSWRFDTSVLGEIAQPTAQKPEKINLKTISARAMIFGYELSQPTPNTEGELWVKAIALDKHSDSASLIDDLGFKYIAEKQIYVLKIS